MNFFNIPISFSFLSDLAPEGKQRSLSLAEQEAARKEGNLPFLVSGRRAAFSPDSDVGPSKRARLNLGSGGDLGDSEPERLTVRGRGLPPGAS
jgi:hypothetical protein